MAFKATNYFLFEKPKKDLDNELLEDFNPWMSTKIFSFYDDGKLVDYINDTLNVYGDFFQSKEDQFRFFESIIPKVKKKNITYIKKSKIDKKDLLPIPEFYSRREIDMIESLSKYQHERTSSSID